MSKDLAVYETDQDRPLTAVDVRAQVNLIQEVMQGVMQKGQHYGTVPGCGDKPTLLKPGAEKIMATFRLSADPEVEDMSNGDVIRYRVKCRLLTQSGIFKGAGIGECSSEEEKYKWRSVVSTAEWNATTEDMKRTKFKRDSVIQQIRTNPYDLANTILKMAKKRALVDAVLTATAASDIFTQDIEDMPEEMLNRGNSETKPSITAPQPKAPVAEKPQEKTEITEMNVCAIIEKVNSKEGKSGNKVWTLYGVLADGIWYNTFDSNLAELATAMVGMKVDLFYVKTEKGNNLTGISEIDDAD